MRDVLLDRLLHTPADVLNTAPALEDPGQAVDVAAELKSAVNAFKAAAWDEKGIRVDYARLRDSEAYSSYRSSCAPLLGLLDLTALSTRGEQLAFWINLYNALVIDAVITFGVRQSVTEGRIGLLRFFRRAAYEVGGLRFSCDDIEHGILRGNRGHLLIPGPQFAPSDPRRSWVMTPPDPRIHFALNCASRSCPPIGVYDANLVDQQLDQAAGNFINADVAIDQKQGEVELSSIFRWYAGDFGGRAGVVALLLRYLPPEDNRRRWLADHQDQARLVYRPYDWTLNT
jgi:hypothetical protein